MQAGVRKSFSSRVVQPWNKSLERWERVSILRGWQNLARQSPGAAAHPALTSLCCCPAALPSTAAARGY